MQSLPCTHNLLGHGFGRCSNVGTTPLIFIPSSSRPPTCLRAITSAEVPSRSNSEQQIVSKTERPAHPPSSPSSSPQAPIVYVPTQKTHSLHAEGFEVIHSLGEWAEHKLLRYLKPAHSSWQPQDLLPEPSSPDFYDQVSACLVWEAIVLSCGCLYHLIWSMNCYVCGCRECTCGRSQKFMRALRDILFQALCPMFLVFLTSTKTCYEHKGTKLKADSFECNAELNAPPQSHASS